MVRFSRPSIDVTFISAGDAYPGQTLGIVLTGANDDGARGLRHIVNRGGKGIVQDPATAESPTMPRAAKDAVPEAEVLGLEKIPGRMLALSKPALRIRQMNSDPYAPRRARGMTEDRRVKLLLVDDRPENLLALKAILEPLGQILVSAHSGEEALKCVLQHDFACILLDVQMPDMNGFDAAQIIKSREKSRYIPIIFLSAINKEDSYVFKGYSMGAVDYVFKPFNPDVLRSKVAVFVDLYLKQQQLMEQAEMLAESQRRELELEHRAELLEAEAKICGAAHRAQRQAQGKTGRARAGDGSAKPFLRFDES